MRFRACKTPQQQKRPQRTNRHVVLCPQPSPKISNNRRSTTRTIGAERVRWTELRSCLKRKGGRPGAQPGSRADRASTRCTRRISRLKSKQKYRVAPCEQIVHWRTPWKLESGNTGRAGRANGGKRECRCWREFVRTTPASHRNRARARPPYGQNPRSAGSV